MNRAVHAGLVAVALCLAGCEEILQYISECSGPGECTANDGRCIGSVLEVCRGDDLCPQQNFWETKEDCAATARVCVQVNPHVAWCAAANEVPTSVLAKAALP